MEYGSRSWMYNRKNPGRRGMREEFAVGVAEFIAKAKTHDDFIRNGEIKCPCVRCKCTKGKNLVDVEMHLYKKGFMPNYFVWVYHGESREMRDDVNLQNVCGGGSGPSMNLDNYRMNNMVEPHAKELYASAADEAMLTNQASDCESSTPAPMTLKKETALWLEMNGGVKKGCAYGLGSSDRLNQGLFGSYSTPASSIHPSMKALLNKIEEFERKHEEYRLRTEAFNNNMREMVQKIMSNNSYKRKKNDKGKSKGKSMKKGKRRCSSSSESESSS